MNNKRIIAALIGAVVFFLGGYIIFGLILESYMQAGMTEGISKKVDEMNASSFIHIFLANLLFSYLLTHIFDAWAKVSTPLDGAKNGALIGFITCLSWDLGLFSTTHLFTDMGKVLVDSLAFGILSALGGAAIGWWLSRGAGTKT